MIEQLELLLRIALAGLLGGAIGYEREVSNHQAGLRTMSLVCVGAALIMSTDILYHNVYKVTTDYLRLAAQVVSGIGFLGAGAIIQNRLSIKGLTTAATLWLSACIGLAVGAGFYLIAIVTTALTIITLTLLKKVDYIISGRKKGPFNRIIMSYDNQKLSVRELIEMLQNYSISLSSINFDNQKDDGTTQLEVVLRRVDKEANIHDLSKLESFLKEIAQLEGVIDVSMN